MKPVLDLSATPRATPRGDACRLLEINIISAQHLHPATRSMSTYAVTWIRPDHKLCTRIDSGNHTAPHWNDKFIFRVDDSFIKRETSAIMVEIYCTRWFRDTLIGSVRVLVSNFLQPDQKGAGGGRTALKCNAVQLWRPSGSPQGILNISLNVLDGPVRSVPMIYAHLDSVMGCQDLIEDGFGKMRRNRSAYDLEECMAVQEEDDHVPELRKLGKALSFGGTEWMVDGSSMMDYHHAEVESSVQNWSVNSGGGREQLRQKLEKWRAELPSVYDFRLDELVAYSMPRTLPSPGGSADSRRSNGGRGRREGGGGGRGGGLFGCFSGGCEISIKCGGSPKKHRR